MKKLIIAFLAAVSVMVCAGAESTISIKINNEDFKTSAEPIIVNDRVMVPMRDIFEEFGAEVIWEGESKQIIAIKGGDVVVMQVDNNKMFAENTFTVLDAAPIIVNDRTLVPLRAVSTSFEAKVDWDNDTRTVYISYDKAEDISVSIEVEGYGVMTAELYPNIAPETVANFVKLANEGFYDGLVFHRVIDGFMIQGGGYDKDLNQKEAQSIKGEFAMNGYGNSIKHTTGVLSMARSLDMNSASSQFFIMDGTAEYLDGEYAAFGRLTDGFDVLEKISELKTETRDNDMEDVPVELPVIKSIRVNG